MTNMAITTSRLPLQPMEDTTNKGNLQLRHRVYAIDYCLNLGTNLKLGYST